MKLPATVMKLPTTITKLPATVTKCCHCNGVLGCCMPQLDTGIKVNLDLYLDSL